MQKSLSRQVLGVVGAAFTAVVSFIVAVIPAGAMTVTFVRHGESQANADGIINTEVPGPGLTPTGQEPSGGDRRRPEQCTARRRLCVDHAPHSADRRAIRRVRQQGRRRPRRHPGDQRRNLRRLVGGRGDRATRLRARSAGLVTGSAVRADPRLRGWQRVRRPRRRRSRADGEPRQRRACRLLARRDDHVLDDDERRQS